MKKIRIITAVLIASLLTVIQFSNPMADFNGDGVSELVIGIPGDDPYYGGSYITGAGAFDVLYGKLGIGLSDDNEQYLSQGVSGVVDDPEGGDGMGNALSVGDFNGDGNWDLAVGVYRENIGDDVDAGGVQVFHGDGEALTVTDYMITQDTAGVDSSTETGDQFGEVLAAGNFNNDAFDDLAIGVPHEDDGDITDSGVVHILFGSASGLTGTGSQMLKQGYNGLPDSGEENDNFGSALSVGDFDADGKDDLAIGVPQEDLDPPDVPVHVPDTGVVHIVYGAHTSDPGYNDDFLYEDSATFDLCGNSNINDRFGESLETGKFNAGIFDDLIIGTYWATETGHNYYGNIHVVFGGVGGLSDSGDQCWDGHTMVYLGVDFCFSLASCDFNGDGFSDLAMGAPTYTEQFIHEHGGVEVVYGSESGIAPSTAVLFQQGMDGMQENREDDDMFGYALIGGNFNGDHYCDLAIGVPFEDVDDPVVTNAGIVQILFGSPDGITTQGNQLWYQGSPGIWDLPGSSDLFGFALASIPVQPDYVYLPLMMK